LQKKIFNKVKHDLEQWREVILLLNSVLKWDQQFFPGVIGGVISIVFLILWWLDFSSLTLIALITIFITVLDFGYPLVSKFIFKPDNWSGSQEKLYEQVIQEIVDVKLCITGCISSFFNSRSERSTFVSCTIRASCDILILICCCCCFSISLPSPLEQFSSLG
jgi:hypothetical protein